MDTFTKFIYRLLTIGCWVSLLASVVSLRMSWVGNVVAANYWSTMITVDLAVMVGLFLVRVVYGIVRRQLKQGKGN